MTRNFSNTSKFNIRWQKLLYEIDEKTEDGEVPEDHKLGGGGEGWSTAADSRIQPRRKNIAVFSVQDSALLSVSQTGLVRSGGGQ